MAERRVSMLSASLRRYEDPTHSADPRIRQLIASLATVEPAPEPRSHFRAELRAQLVAVAPRLIAEGPAIERPRARPAAPAVAVTSPAAKLRGAFGFSGQFSLARPMATVAAAVVVFAMLLGGAVFISKKALPGDSLYSLKRANENVALSMATGDTARGREYLRLAKTRTDEVAALLSRSSASADGAGPSAAAGVNSHTAGLITTTLNSADSDTRSGSKLLSGQAVRNGSADPLASLTSWAPDQIARLQAITDRLGPGPLHNRAAASTVLATNAFVRAQTLKSELACNCLDKAGTDELGPLPCAVCTSVPAPTQRPTLPTATTTTHGVVPTPKVSGGSGPATNLPTVSVPRPSGSGPPLTFPPVPTVVVQTLPTSLPSATAPGGATCSLSILGICLLP